ncbi:MAG: patatin-like phospholipase family protein [bacterium]|nr:patatin-like phospholipase family protein [bacterium]
MKRAIVLAGGGSKGAYQIGAWKALRELNITFDIVTGTSIGAVNGAMIVQDDYEKAYEFWKELSVDQVMNTNIPINNNITISNGLGTLRHQKEQLVPFVKDFMANKGADIQPFKDGLDEYLDEKRLMESKIAYGLMTVKFPNMVPVEITKEKIKPGYLQKWVLASASCFPAFPICKIDESSFIDGGYYDNLPIDTAFRLGADEVIAISLKSPAPTKSYLSNPLVTIIEPSHSLGGFLEFETEGITNNMSLGYNDTMKTFGKLCGKSYSFCMVEQSEYEEIARMLMLKMIRKELGRSCRVGRRSLRSEKKMSAVDFLLGNTDKQDLFTCFLLFLENCMQVLQYDYYKIYEIDVVLEEIKGQAHEPAFMGKALENICAKEFVKAISK